MKKLALSLLVASSIIHAEEIVIGPPPLAYVPNAKVGTTSNFMLNYLSLEQDIGDTTSEMIGGGIGFGQRSINEDQTFSDWSMFIGGVDGDAGEAELSTTMISGKYLFGANMTPELSGFFGGTFSYSTTNIYLDPPAEDIESTMTMLMAQAGLQYALPVAGSTFIPWLALSQPVVGTIDTGDTSEDIEGELMYQIGFDIYFDAIGTSLSSMYQSSAESELVSLSLNFNF